MANAHVEKSTNDRLYRWALALLAVLAPEWSYAEEPSSLVAPQLTRFVEAEYPAQAQADGLEAVVELGLVVGTDGRVHEAIVLAPAGNGFDEAARAAAESFEFTPATKSGTPIAAKIRYRYVFELRPIVPSTGILEGRVLWGEDDSAVARARVSATRLDGSVVTALTDSSGAFRLADLAPGSVLVEVFADDARELESNELVVAGEATHVVYRIAKSARGGVLEFGAVAKVDAPPREVTRRTVTAEEAGRVAGTRGDALRAVEVLPGVARPPSGGGMILVRGSSDWDSETVFEGAPVYNLYHFGGLTSFVNSRLLDQIDLYSGNFSARFGRKTGGIVEVGMRDPRTDGVHGVLDFNVIDGSILVEGPAGRDLAFAAAARRSFIEGVLGAMGGVDGVATPVYRDYQAMLSWTPTEADRVRLMVYGNGDEMRMFLDEPSEHDPAFRGGLGQANEFHRVASSWKRVYGPGREHEIQATAGVFDSRANLGPLSIALSGNEAHLRAEWRERVLPWMQVIGGTDVFYASLGVGYTGNRFSAMEGAPEGTNPIARQEMIHVEERIPLFRPAGFVEAILTPDPRVQLVLGGRGDWYDDLDAGTFDPRANGRWQITERTALKGGVGRFSQPPQYHEAVPGLGNPGLEPSHAMHYSAGVEQKVGEPLVIGLEGFYKTLDGLVVNRSGSIGPMLVNDGIGRIHGVEFSGRLAPTGGLFAVVSYTYSKSERNDRGEGWRLFDHDQTHNLAASAGYRFGSWELGASVRATTGEPVTPVTGSVYDANYDLYVPVWGRLNSERDPAFKRVDIRVEKTWELGGAKRVAAYLDLQNATNATNQEGRSYSYDFHESRAVPSLPILPSLGLKAEF